MTNVAIGPGIIRYAKGLHTIDEQAWRGEADMDPLLFSYQLNDQIIPDDCHGRYPRTAEAR